MAIHPNVLTDLAPQPYAKVRETVRDGDLLLCSATDPFSRLIRWGTKSPWSHIAIAYRLEDIGRVIVLESVAKIGVRAVPLSNFISRTSAGVTPYPGQILLARHRGMGAKSRRQPIRKMEKFAFDRLGDKFSTRDMVKIALRIALGRFERKMPHSLGAKHEFICSEYVARCFQELGLEIPWDGLGFIAPCDFALDPRIEAVAQIKT
jgi:hypothetical protein